MVRLLILKCKKLDTNSPVSEAPAILPICSCASISASEVNRIDNKLEEVMKMCQSIADIEKAAGLLGISVDEIQSVLGYNA